MKIITTVGTSLIVNSNVDCQSLEREPFDEKLFDGKEDNNIKKGILNKERDLKRFIQDYTACAELASLAKIDPKDDAEIILLCTETVASFMCGRVLQKHLGERAKVKCVKGLQVKDLQRFKQEGVPNLLAAIEQVAQDGNYWSDLVLNVTGGYKATIPIMTIIGQIRKIPIYYIFQEDDDSTNELINIPRMPIDFQTQIFEKYEPEFQKFGENADGLCEKTNLSFEFLQECEGCLEIDGNTVAINSVGKILWWNYRQQFFTYWSTNDVWSQVKQQADILRILQTKLCDGNIRSNKTEKKQDHLVFDDGNNNNRIYYFEQNDALYIYNTFENEEKARAYILTAFTEKDRQSFISRSKPFRVSIKK